VFYTFRLKGETPGAGEGSGSKGRRGRVRTVPYDRPKPDSSLYGCIAVFYTFRLERDLGAVFYTFRLKREE